MHNKEQHPFIWLDIPGDFINKKTPGNIRPLLEFMISLVWRSEENAN